MSAIATETASPLQILEAWQAAMHHAHPRAHAIELDRAHPIPEGMVDPIFVTPVDDTYEWHRAADIGNPEARAAIRKYLLGQGLHLPPEVTLAWAGRMEKEQWLDEIHHEVELSLSRHVETAKIRDDLWGGLLADLKRAAHHGR